MPRLLITSFIVAWHKLIPNQRTSHVSQVMLVCVGRVADKTPKQFLAFLVFRFLKTFRKMVLLLHLISNEALLLYDIVLLIKTAGM